MLHKERKYFWMWQLDKEEKWINEMSAQGWQLQCVGFWKYCFVKGEPGEYVYRVEFLKARSDHYEIREYIDFIKESGIEEAASRGYRVFFRKKAGQDDFELFSDTDSRINYLHRLLYYTGSYAFMCASLGLLQLLQ